MNQFLDALRKKRGSQLSTSTAHIFQRMSLIEKACAIIFSLALLIGTLFLVRILYINLSTEIPSYGGTLHEGIIGIPRFINPILAMTPADQDLTTLVYSGLLRTNTEGVVEPNLAETLPIQIDNKTYEVTIRDDAFFHDGIPVTADDVVFTIRSIQNSFIRSPLQSDWAGIEVEKVSTKTVRFTLPQPYAPFIYNLSVGILPRHIWEPVGDEQFAFSDYNITPIGSGPYKITSIERNTRGQIRSFTLKSFEEYTLGQPYITTVVFHIYSDVNALEQALQRSSLTAGVSKNKLDHKKSYVYPVRRIFSVFFNESNSKIIRDDAVRQALSLVISREDIIHTVLQGNGIAVDEPLPSFMIQEEQAATSSMIEEAISILEEHGWQKNEETGIMEKRIDNAIERLSFSLHTSDTKDLLMTAQALVRSWKQIGADVVVNPTEVSRLIVDVVRPRSFDALLFGQVINRDNDLYAYWHSSGRNDPGLNVSLFAHRRADEILDHMRLATSSDHSLYDELNTIITKEIPAIFLYAPTITYSVDSTVHGITDFPVVYPSERFTNIHTWYMKTKRMWNAFIK